MRKLLNSHSGIIVLQGDVAVEVIKTCNNLKLVVTSEVGGKHQRGGVGRDHRGIDHVVGIVYNAKQTSVARSVEVEYESVNTNVRHKDRTPLGIILTKSWIISQLLKAPFGGMPPFVHLTMKTMPLTRITKDFSFS